jgi:hypothetical protein
MIRARLECPRLAVIDSRDRPVMTSETHISSLAFEINDDSLQMILSEAEDSCDDFCHRSCRHLKMKLMILKIILFVQLFAFLFYLFWS